MKKYTLVFFVLFLFAQINVAQIPHDTMEQAFLINKVATPNTSIPLACLNGIALWQAHTQRKAKSTGHNKPLAVIPETDLTIRLRRNDLTPSITLFTLN